MNKEWFEEWFASEDYLDVYKHRNSRDTDNLIKLILKNISISSNAKVLDAACGAGRHSIKFAENGFNVTGFDLSETLLDKAINEAKKRELNINFQLADLRKFLLEEKFDLVVNLFTSFGYFSSDEENFSFAQNAFRMLNKNGYYILDYLNKNYLKENLVEFTEKDLDDKKILETRTISDGRVVKKIEIKKNGHSSEFLESVKLYSYNELITKFENIGFKEVSVFGDYSGENYNIDNSERCIIIFQK